MIRRLLVLVLVLLLAVSGIASAQDESYTIGVSNNFVGSEWRTQMVKQIEDAAAVIEEELGIRMSDLIENYCGGMRGGKKYKARLFSELNFNVAGDVSEDEDFGGGPVIGEPETETVEVSEPPVTAPKRRGRPPKTKA